MTSFCYFTCLPKREHIFFSFCNSFSLFWAAGLELLKSAGISGSAGVTGRRTRISEGAGVIGRGTRISEGTGVAGRRTRISEGTGVTGRRTGIPGNARVTGRRTGIPGNARVSGQRTGVPRDARAAGQGTGISGGALGTRRGAEAAPHGSGVAACASWGRRYSIGSVTASGSVGGTVGVGNCDAVSGTAAARRGRINTSGRTAVNGGCLILADTIPVKGIVDVIDGVGTIGNHFSVGWI